MPSPQDTGRKVISSPQVAAKCGVTNRGLYNWKNDPSLDFPTGIRVRERDYFYEDEIDAWLLARAKASVKRRVA